MTCDDATRELFILAIKRMLLRRPLPCNISTLNDIMRVTDRKYHINQTGFPNFSMLCRFFEKEGLLELTQKGSSVMVKSTKYEAEVQRHRSRTRSRSRDRRRGPSRSRSPPPRRRAASGSALPGPRGATADKRRSRSPAARRSASPSPKRRRLSGSPAPRRGRAASPAAKRARSNDSRDSGGDRWELGGDDRWGMS